MTDIPGIMSLFSQRDAFWTSKRKKNFLSLFAQFRSFGEISFKQNKILSKKTWTVNNNNTPFRYYTERKKNHGFLSWKEEEEGSFFSTWAEENKILGRRCWSLPRGDPSSSTRKTLLKISLRVSSGAVGQPGAAEVAHQPQVESLSLSHLLRRRVREETPFFLSTFELSAAKKAERCFSPQVFGLRGEKEN